MSDKIPDLTTTAVYRRFGLAGIKVFAVSWFPVMYLVVGGIFVAAISLHPMLALREAIFIGAICCIGCAIATVLLTRMLKAYRLGLRALENRDWIPD